MSLLHRGREGQETSLKVFHPTKKVCTCSLAQICRLANSSVLFFTSLKMALPVYSFPRLLYAVMGDMQALSWLEFF